MADINRKGRQAVGHPVDVASGIVYTEREDFTLPGTVPLLWARRYGTDLLDRPPSILGPGWTTSLMMDLQADLDGFCLYDENGSEVFFNNIWGTLEEKGVLYNAELQVELRREGDLFKVVKYSPDDDPTLCYVFQPDAQKDRWPLAWIESRTGWRLDVRYDQQRRPVQLFQQREQRRLYLEYDARHQRLARVVMDGASRRVELARYEYDQQGRLIAAYDAGGYADHYEYDEQNRLVADMPRGLGRFTFVYDAQGRCVYTSGQDGYQENHLRFDDAAQTTLVENSHGETTRYGWNEWGQVISEVSPLGHEQTTQYDEWGRVVKEIDPMGGVLSYAYDEQGHLVQVSDPLGQTYELVYNEQHLPVQWIDALGHTWLREYDERGLITATLDPQGGRWAYHHNAQGDLVKVVNPQQAEMTFSYDGFGRVVAQSDWEGHFARFVYDVFGNVAEYVDVLGNRERYTADARGDLLQIEYPNGATVAFAWNAQGDLTRITDTRGRTVRYEYGVHGHLVRVIDARGGQQRYDWDTEPARLLQVHNELGEVYTCTYDADGRLVKEVGFDGSEMHYEYDAAGMCIAITNGLKERILLERDVGGRMVRKVLPDGQEVTFAYDAHNYIVEAANATCDLAFERDAMGKVLKETLFVKDTQAKYSVESVYDLLGARVRRTTSIGHQDIFGYDRNGQLTMCHFPQATLRLMRDVMGREEERRFSEGPVLKQAYDRMNLLAQQTLLVPGDAASARLARSFQYDENSNLTAITDARQGTIRYEYNVADQIVRALRNEAVTEYFEYDLAGNVINASGEPHVYSRGGQVMRAGSTRYEYDADGRMIARIEPEGIGREKRWSFQWDAEQRLRAVTTPEGAAWTYSYDPLGRRIAKKGPEGAVQYVWDGNTLVHEIASEGPANTWLFDDETFAPIVKLEPQAAYFAVNDRLGTPHALVRQDGAVAWSVTHTTWGKIDTYVAAETQCPVRFPGQWFDEESGWAYNWFRYYDANLARYTTLDPLGLEAGVHLYQYVPNPTSWIDPYGLAGRGGGPFNVDADGNMTRADGSRVPLPRDKCSCIVTTPEGVRRAFVSGWGEGVTNWNAGRNSQHRFVQRVTRGGVQGNWTHAEMHALNWVLNQRGIRNTTVTLQIRFPPCTQGGTGCRHSLRQLRRNLARRGITLRVIPRNVHTCP